MRKSAHLYYIIITPPLFLVKHFGEKGILFIFFYILYICVSYKKFPFF